MLSQEDRLKLWHLLVLFCGAALFRWVITPNHNLAEDPFELIEAGKHLLQTGEYRVPSIGAADMVMHQKIPSWPVGLPLALAGVFSVFGGTFNRTVSANLGMSYSISNVCAEATMPNIIRWMHLEMNER